ncbi:MAG: ABC transporter ATP-binding protein [Phycisphaerales bacterium]|nr:ABC transporter ATP-binding protein [Phycisphaerales bacterium]
MSAVLALEGLTKSFGDTPALRGVSFTLGSGQWIGLLGPNGAGKTTTVRAIAGRVRPDGGSITLFGQNVTTDDPGHARHRLGVVPQDLALYPTLTALENLQTFAALHGLTPEQSRERARWALAWTGLEERRRDLVRTFSGGMKRRLNIACGVLHRPHLILLDEPTVGVDPQSRERIWEMLSELRTDGASLLLTTHQLDEAQQVCERILIIDGGEVIADGTLRELIARTVGEQRRVVVTLDAAVSAGAFEAGVEIDDVVVQLATTDIASDLPRVLDGVSRAGRRVEDVRIIEPSLQAVFLHLTGRELRE